MKDNIRNPCASNLIVYIFVSVGEDMEEWKLIHITIGIIVFITAFENNLKAIQSIMTQKFHS